MAKVVGKITFPNGTYMKEGEEKTRWLHCGVLLLTDKGYRIKLDALPINMGEGWFQVFEDDDNKSTQSRPSPQKGQESIGEQDDIPF